MCAGSNATTTEDVLGEELGSLVLVRPHTAYSRAHSVAWHTCGYASLAACTRVRGWEERVGGGHGRRRGGAMGVVGGGAF